MWVATEVAGALDTCIGGMDSQELVGIMISPSARSVRWELPRSHQFTYLGRAGDAIC